MPPLEPLRLLGRPLLISLAVTVFSVTAATRGPPVRAGEDPCAIGWREGLFPAPGVAAGSVRAFQVFDDGSGPALYAGGEFQVAGDTFSPGLARWDGAAWSRPAGGLDGSVTDLVRGDLGDGAGEVLFLAGTFILGGGSEIYRVARWDGAAFTPLSPPVSAAFFIAFTLAVFDEGAGPRLFAGGSRFDLPDGAQTFGLARFDGAAWTSVGGGVADRVDILQVLDDGSGVALYVGGRFERAGTTSGEGGIEAKRLARWDGASWSEVGGGLDGLGAQTTVLALHVHDDGSGPALFAGGSFTFAGGGAGLFSPGIAKWDGAAWQDLDGGLVGVTVRDLVTTAVTGGSPLLYAAGARPATTTPLESWDGAAWSEVASFEGSIIYTVAAFDGGAGERLYAGGTFIAAGGVPVARAASWDGGAWEPLTTQGFNRDLRALLVADLGDGKGPALYAAGRFTHAGGGPGSGIARYDGESWTAMGEDLLVPGREVEIDAVGFLNDGSGPALYAAGGFREEFGTMARWDGNAWSPLSAPAPGGARVLLAAELDGRSALYAGGSFAFEGPGGLPQFFALARFDGEGWSAPGAIEGTVNALALFDDGRGPALYVGGRFSRPGGVIANHIARFDGASWSAVGLGAGLGGDGEVLALAVLDDGSGPALYAAGSFVFIPGVGAVGGFARWDGTAWAALDPSMRLRSPLVAFDDGTGAALYGAGGLALADGSRITTIARFDGASWSSAGDFDRFGGGTVHAFAVAPVGLGQTARPALYAGGDFGAVAGVGSAYLARLDGRPRPRITGQPVGGTFCAGAKLTLEVAAEGEVAGLQWRRYGEEIPGATSAVLTIDPVRAEDAGVYDVVVGGPCAPVMSAPAVVEVAAPPSFASEPDGRRIELCGGERLELRVETAGTPPLAFEWRRGGKLLAGEDGPELVREAVAAAEAGVYTVRVTHPCGEIEAAVAEVVVLEARVCDCNSNGVLDREEIAADPGLDEDQNGVIDECERPRFHRADPNADGVTNLSDAIAVLGLLFRGGTRPGCREAADANNDGEIDVSDAVRILIYLYAGAPPPPAPGPAEEPCGTDPDPPGSAGDIGCGVYEACG